MEISFELLKCLVFLSNFISFQVSYFLVISFVDFLLFLSQSFSKCFDFLGMAFFQSLFSVDHVS